MRATNHIVVTSSAIQLEHTRLRFLVLALASVIKGGLWNEPNQDDENLGAISPEQHILHIVYVHQ
jgi:hypothetical protein